jgi:hypothetical protein
MKMDPLILGMTKGDVTIILSMVIRDHLACECVDRRDPEVHADHVAEKVADVLQTEPDVDGSYAEYARSILNRDRS